MEKRKTDLLKNDLFLASFYLDPRCKAFISEIDQIVATQYLQQTWSHVKLLQQGVASDLSGTQSDSSKTFSTDDDLDMLTAQQHRQSFTSMISPSNNAMQSNSIMVLFSSFANKARLGKKRNCFEILGTI